MTATPEPTESDPSGSEGGSDANTQCATKTAFELAAQGVEEVPIPDGHDGATWDVDRADVDGFDPCKGLTQIIVPLSEGGSTTPNTILMFHNGELIGPATEESYSFEPTIERIDQESIRIIYPYLEDGDANAGPTGEAVATFTWDDASQSVTMEGELPPAL